MAKKLDKTKVEMGSLIRVANQNRKPHESYDYYAVKLENQDGCGEAWYLFTGVEVTKFSLVQVEGADKFKRGRMYCKHTIGNTTRCFVRLLIPLPDACEATASLQDWTVTLTRTQLDRARARAKKNAEDVPAMSWLKDLKD